MKEAFPHFRDETLPKATPIARIAPLILFRRLAMSFTIARTYPSKNPACRSTLQIPPRFRKAKLWCPPHGRCMRCLFGTESAKFALRAVRFLTHFPLPKVGAKRKKTPRFFPKSAPLSLYKIYNLPLSTFALLYAKKQGKYTHGLCPVAVLFLSRYSYNKV